MRASPSFAASESRALRRTQKRRPWVSLHVVPFLVEDELKRLGGLYEQAPSWEPLAIADGRLLTGQNPASSTAAAKLLLKLLGRPASSWTSVEVARNWCPVPLIRCASCGWSDVTSRPAIEGCFASIAVRLGVRACAGSAPRAFSRLARGRLRRQQRCGFSSFHRCLNRETSSQVFAASRRGGAACAGADSKPHGD